MRFEEVFFGRSERGAVHFSITGMVRFYFTGDNFF
jgi:hypothetical protein